MFNMINIVSNNNYIKHINIYNFIKNYIIYKIILTNLQNKIYLFYNNLFFSKNTKNNINNNFYKKIYII